MIIYPKVVQLFSDYVACFVDRVNVTFKHASEFKHYNVKVHKNILDNCASTFGEGPFIGVMVSSPHTFGSSVYDYIFVLFHGREVQKHREAFVEKLAAYHQEQATNKEELISKAAAESEAKQDKQQREMDKKKAAMLKKIAEHREAVVNSISENILCFMF